MPIKVLAIVSGALLVGSVVCMARVKAYGLPAILLAVAFGLAALGVFLLGRGFPFLSRYVFAAASLALILGLLAPPSRRRF